jgi:hypothetical protein
VSPSQEGVLLIGYLVLFLRYLRKPHFDICVLYILTLVVIAVIISGKKKGNLNYHNRYSRCSEVVIALHRGHNIVQCIAFVKVQILDRAFEFLPFRRNDVGYLRGASRSDIHGHMSET